MQHPVVWFEVVGKEGPALQRFYTDLFGWTMNTDNPMRYGIVEANGKGIPGGVGGPMPNGRGGVTFYVETPDPAASLASVERLGGRVVTAPYTLPDGTTIALFADPEGHVIGLVKEATS